MSTPSETDESREPTGETPGTGRVRLRDWARDAWIRSAGPAHISYRWLLASVLLGFVFLGCAIWAAVETVQLDNRVTQQQVADSIASQIATCEITNERRAEAKVVASDAIEADQASLDRDEAALHNDEDNWMAIDDLFETGIPEPARGIIFQGLEARQETIEQSQALIDKRREDLESTFRPTDCELISAIAPVAEATS